MQRRVHSGGAWRRPAQGRATHHVGEAIAAESGARDASRAAAATGVGQAVAGHSAWASSEAADGGTAAASGTTVTAKYACDSGVSRTGASVGVGMGDWVSQDPNLGP